MIKDKVINLIQINSKSGKKEHQKFCMLLGFRGIGLAQAFFLNLLPIISGSTLFAR